MSVLSTFSVNLLRLFTLLREDGAELKPRLFRLAWGLVTDCLSLSRHRPVSAL